MTFAEASARLSTYRNEWLNLKRLPFLLFATALVVPFLLSGPRIPLGPADIGIPQLLFLTSLGLVVVMNESRKELLGLLKPIRWVLLVFIAFIGIAVISSLLSVDRPLALKGTTSYVLSFVIMLGAYYFGHQVRKLNIDRALLFRLVIIGAFTLALPTLLFSLVYVDLPWEAKSGGPGRTIGNFQLPFDRRIPINIAFGTFGQIVLTAAVFQLFRLGLPWKSSLKQVGYVSIFAVLVFSVISLQSRSTWVAMTVAFSIGLFFFIESRRLRRAYVSAIALCLIISGVFISLRGVDEVLSLFSGPGSEVSVELRKSDYTDTVDQLTDFPSAIFGLGPLIFAEYERDIKLELHNAFLDRAVATGIVGGSLFLALVVMIVVTAVRKISGETNEDHRWLMTALLLALVANLIEMLAHPAVSDQIFWVLCGWILVPTAVWFSGSTSVIGDSENTGKPVASGESKLEQDSIGD